MRISFLPLASALALGLYVGCSTGTPPAPDNAGTPPITPSGVGDGGALTETGAPSGADLVKSLGCPRCHTSSAGEFAGATDPVSGTQVYPANLTPDKDTGIGDWTDEKIIQAIRTGYDDEDEELCPTMPRFSDVSDDDAKTIVGYLRSLKPVNHEVPESVCPPLKTGDDGDDDGGTDDDSGTTDSGADAASCSDYAAPNTKAPCAASGATQNNGCKSNLFCYKPTKTCVPRPPGCIFPI
jgi:Cytochrome c